MNRPIGHVSVGVCFTSMNRLQSERDEIASEKRGFHMTIEGDLRHFHNQYIDDAIGLQAQSPAANTFGTPLTRMTSSTGMRPNRSRSTGMSVVSGFARMPAHSQKLWVSGVMNGRTWRGRGGAGFASKACLIPLPMPSALSRSGVQAQTAVCDGDFTG